MASRAGLYTEFDLLGCIGAYLGTLKVENVYRACCSTTSAELKKLVTRNNGDASPENCKTGYDFLY